MDRAAYRRTNVFVIMDMHEIKVGFCQTINKFIAVNKLMAVGNFEFKF